MKKVTLLVSQKHTVDALHTLRQLGFMHIKHIQEPQAHYITDIEHKLANLDKALAIIDELSSCVNSLRDNPPGANILSSTESSNAAKEIITLNSRKQKTGERLGKLREKKLWFDRWGNVSSSALAELKEVGVSVKLYAGSKKDFKRIPEKGLVCVVSRKGGDVCFAYVSDSEERLPGFDEVEVPNENLHSLNRKMSATSMDLKEVEQRLGELAGCKESFTGHKKELLKGLEFCKVRFGMSYSEEIGCLQGFCPEESAGKITRAAKAQGWATVIEEPDKAEEAPTLIRNPRWLKVIEPVFKFIETVPGYKEYDISLWFLLFFSLFFAMIIGDAGYGLVFLAATFLIRKKLKKAPSAPFFLMYVLSAATVIWGAITGTWFGAEQIAKAPFFNNLIIGRINTFVDANQLFLIYLCFLIGAIHLTIAHGVVAIRVMNSLIALAHIGWICVLWGIFFLAGKLVLGNPFPGFATGLLYAGIGLVLLFSNPQKNILKGVLISLANLPLKLINSFGDILSYLRLFAVGYASAMVAVSCNQMALGVGFSSIITSLGAALILFLGHAINIALGILSVLVHGLRLNMLEFSGHLGMEWSGQAYKPFRE